MRIWLSDLGMLMINVQTERPSSGSATNQFAEVDRGVGVVHNMETA